MSLKFLKLAKKKKVSSYSTQMGILLGVLSRCSGVPRGSQEAQWVNLVTKKFVYSSDIVVGFENFEIGQKTKKLAPTAPDWASP